MTERAELMRIYRSNGISSISLMRDHYNKHDNGGDIQPSDATFRATLTNPVNSYRSNAPAGIGDAAITKATGLLNPITAATLTAAPLGAISKINAAAKAYKAAKIANPIIASTIGASSTSRYQIPTYIEVENQKVPLVRYKTDLEKEMIPKISEEYYNRIEKDNIINPEFMRVEKNIENESKEGYKNGRWYPHLSPEGGAKTIGYGDKLVPSYEYKRDRAFIKRAHAEGISDEEANNRLNYNLKVSLDAVRKDIINKYGYEAWDTMYPSLKRGLTDIRFNVGPNKEYPKATEAAIRNNIEQFMKEQKDGRSPRRVDSINTLFIDQLKNL